MDSGSVAMSFGAGRAVGARRRGENLSGSTPRPPSATGEEFPVAAGGEGRVAVDDGAVWVSGLNRVSLLRLSW